MLRRLYDRTIQLAGHRHAEPALALMCFAESSFLPMLPEVMLLPMIIADRRKAWRLATICTVASVLGGIAGYFIGVFLFDTVGQPLLKFYGLHKDFNEIAEQYNDMGWLMVLIGGGMTPIPYKVITIASGLTRLDFAVFVGVSIIARAFRFFVPCALIYYFGPQARALIETRLKLVFWVSLAAIIGGFFIARYMF